MAVNLTAPMLLARLLLPSMLAANRGHIVNIASLAGLGAAAFSEPYGATKHGLVGFTRALRASLQTRGSAVSASVICPGFVSDAGMYHDMHTHEGVVAPRTMGTCTPEAVAAAALRAIERDEPEVIVNGKAVRHLLALGVAFPRLVERLAKRLHVHELFHELARQRHRILPAVGLGQPGRGPGLGQPERSHGFGRLGRDPGLGQRGRSPDRGPSARGERRAMNGRPCL